MLCLLGKKTQGHVVFMLARQKKKHRGMYIGDAYSGDTH